MMPPQKRVNKGMPSLPQRLQTPLRDEMKINQEDALMDNTWERSSMISGMNANQVDNNSVASVQNLAFSLK